MKLDPRSVGLLIAAILAGCVLVVIAWVLVQGSNAPTPVYTDPDVEIPELDEIVPIGGGEDVVGSSKTKIRLMDKQNPTRTATLIMGDLNPLDAHRHAVANPSAWHFLTDGRSMHIQSDSGEWYMPSREDGPESGQLEGGWLIRLYDPQDDPIDLDTDVPTLRSTGDAPLEFNTTTGRLETRGRVEVVTDDIEFRCEDVQVVANEISERLEYFIARRGDLIRYRVPTSANEDSDERASSEDAPTTTPGNAIPGNTTPGTVETGPETPVTSEEGAPTTRLADGSTSDDETADTARAPTGPVTPTPGIEAANESMYHIVFTSDVKITWESAQIESDRLDLWVRLIDNRLPEGAIAGAEGIEIAYDARSPMSIGALAGQIVALSLASQDASPAEVAELIWSGTLEILPMDTAPPELTDDHVAFRFTSPSSGNVRFADATRDASGYCEDLRYGATSMRVLMQSATESGVHVESPTMGAATCRVLRADLGEGFAAIEGIGSLADTRENRHIEWTKGADVFFSDREGTNQMALERALFHENVVAWSDEFVLRGGELETHFVETDADPNTLIHLRVWDEVYAEAGDDRLACDRLQVEFEPSPEGDSVPRLVTAQGAVIASRADEATLEAEFVEAALAELEDELTVRFVDARQAVRFTRDDGVEAHADSLLADQVERTATLVGDARVGRGPTTIEGESMKLFDDRRRIEVFGAGRFLHTAEGRVVIDSTWDIDMTYSDDTGMLDASGNVIATHTPREGWKDTLQAHRIHAEIETIEDTGAVTVVDGTVAPMDDPATGPDADPVPSTDDAKATGFASAEPAEPVEPAESVEGDGPELTELGSNRKVTAMHATGLVFDVEDGAPASFESTRREGGELVRAFRLIGPEIDATEAEIRMDHPGRLFVADLRQGDDSEDLGDRRGTALFDWKKDLVIDRAEGVMHMRRQVRMIHNAAQGSEDTLLDCEELTATFTETEDGGELRHVDASGAVYLATREDRTLRNELVADALRYDAVHRTSTALANEGNVVTLFDADRGTPFTAEALFWDLNTDRVEIRDPELVSVPR